MSERGGDWQAARIDRRVVVVEDDEWRRRGLVDGLRELGGALTVFAAMTLHDALQYDGWPQVDIGIVSATGQQDGWDRFDGLKVGPVMNAAAQGSDPGPVAVLIAGSEETNDLLVIRAAEAGFEFVYRREDVRTIEDLERLALAPDISRSPGRIADFPALRRLGLSYSSRLNAGLAFLEESGWGPELGGDGSRTLSRRGAITLRQRLADIVGIRATGGTSAAAVERSLPSWRQVRQIVDAARGATGGDVATPWTGT